MEDKEEQFNSSSNKTETTVEEKEIVSISDTDEELVPPNYKIPSWSAVPPTNSYKFEVIKGGVVIETVPLARPYISIGRQKQCQIQLEHPSISRCHCIVQYKSESNDEAHPAGLYLYDMGSTHGTFLNKNKLKPNCFSKLSVGHIVKFGLSTRMFLLQGPSTDKEEESPFTVTQLKQMREERRMEAERVKQEEKDKKEKKENEGVCWGMGEDAVDNDDDDDEIPDDTSTTGHQLSLEDPKKSLRHWFDSKGCIFPDFEIEELTHSHFSCKIELPLTNPEDGTPIICVVDHKGRKKECVNQCALEACRTINKILRKQHRQKLSNLTGNGNSEENFYSSDEDEFLDRTGDIERKRKRRENESDTNSAVLTFDSLKTKYDAILEQLNSLETKIKEANMAKEKAKQVSEAEDLDDYMDQLCMHVPDKHKIVEWKLEVNKLEKDEIRVRQLLNVARPHGSEEYKRRKSLLLPEAAPIKSNPRIPIKRKIECGVHKIFLEEDDTPKLKLSKLDDDYGSVKAVPYSQPQRTLSRYEQLLQKKEILIKKRRLQDEQQARTPVPTVSEGAENGGDSKVDSASVLAAGSSSGSPADTSDSPTLPVKGPLPELKPPTDDKEETEFVFLKPLPVPMKRTAFKAKRQNMLEKECETWQPPVGQSGDGRTSLNEKFGY